MESNAQQFDPWFITGLVEGEGCFAVSFTFRKKLKVGVETRPSFSISLNQRDLPLVKSIHAYFGCGAVRFSRGDSTYKYESRSIADLTNRIVPHFQEYPLMGGKKQDFEIFASICKRVRSNLHLSKRHLAEIIEDAYQMNPSGKRRIAKRDLLKKLGELKV